MHALEQHRARVGRIRSLPRPLPLAERRRYTVEQVKVGGVVEVDSTVYLIVAKHEYQEGKTWWSELELTSVPNDTKAFLEFERDDDLELSLWSRYNVPLLVIGLTVGQLSRFDDEETGSFEWNGRRFVYNESDRALFYRNGNRVAGEEHYYWDFSNPRGDLISVERWDDTYEAAIGRTLRSSEVTILSLGGT